MINRKLRKMLIGFCIAGVAIIVANYFGLAEIDQEQLDPIVDIIVNATGSD